MLDVEKKMEFITEKFPILQKKKEILDNLFQKNEILPEIYENLSNEFNKALDEIKCEAKNLLSEVEKQIQVQEDSVKSLHLARTFLEIEHGIGNVKDEVYQQSLISILKEMKNVSYKKLNLVKNKDKISNILCSGEEVKPDEETISEQTDIEIDQAGQKPAITVHVTEE